MKTTVMFVADSVPLGGVPVRLSGDDTDDVYVTDEEGKIELDLDLGTHTFMVQVEDDWVERTVHRQGHAPLFVVNVAQSDAQSVTTLNTLQIDLANLVGDRYVFETVLGRGGMGVVVKAIDRMLNRPVAIKMLSDELRENEEAQQIFLVEARNLATLSHPNLVAIHDILNVGGRVLMVFEYVLGENVEKTIKKQGKLSPKEVLRIAIQLTRCVAYLHDHELIHRDLKPANIIMQADGTLKLIDFGLARSLNELYVRGTRVRGTPAYMAPEQIQGIHLTTATDIYQIGISMYEMLAGALPFASGDLAYAHVHLDAPDIREKVSGMDEELATLVHACLSKQPKHRPGSAEALLEQLQQIYARIASGDSQPMGLFDASTTGPLPAVRSEPRNSQLSISEADDMSFAEEVAGGSNRGLFAMATLGLAALAVAGFFLLRGGAGPPIEDREPSHVVETPTAIVEPTPAIEEPPEDTLSETGRSVVAARGVVGLSLATATGRSSGTAAAKSDEEPEARPAPTRVRKVARSRPRAQPEPAVNPAAKEDGEEDVSDETTTSAQAEKEKTPEEAPKKSATLKPSDDQKNNKLLSVEGKGSKSLLPVSD